MVILRFTSIDFEQAKQDVEPFLKDTKELNVGSAYFFCEDYEFINFRLVHR